MAKRARTLQKEVKEKDRQLQALKDEVARLRKLTQQQQKTIETLEKKVQECEEELSNAKRQAHPFKRRKPKSKHKKAGRRKGRGTFCHREKPDKIDRTQEVPLQHCPDCGGTDLDQFKAHENFQCDLPRIEPFVTRFITHSAECACCGKRVQSKHDEQLSQAAGAASVCLGPKAIATAAYMHTRLGTPYEKLEEYFSQVLGFPVTSSGLFQAVSKLAEQSRTVYEQLIETIAMSAFVHADETGWRIGRLSAWLWVFSNSELTVYAIRSGKGARGHEVVLEVLGRKFEGVLISDCFSAYDAKALKDWIKQKCLAHLLKDLAELKQCDQSIVVAFAKETIALFKKAIALKAQGSELPAEQYAKHVDEIEKQFDDLLEQYQSLQHEDAARFLRRLQKQRSHLFTFLHYDQVQATNNHAEGQVRFGVLARKLQRCNKTEAGAKHHETLCSIATTAKQQGHSVVEIFIDIQRGTETHCLVSPPYDLEPVPT